MFMKYSLWKNILFLFPSIYLAIAISNQRENLARRHPCNAINKRLEPYIRWTEKLASTQYKIQKDACSQTQTTPACCTNEIFNSYALSLGKEMKILFDTQLDHVVQMFSLSDKQINLRTKEYITEAQRETISSLETLFGTKEYHSNIHHTISTLFNILGDHQTTGDDVSKTSMDLFNQLILSTYRRFMTLNNDVILDDQLQKCLINKASDIKALPTQPELLYTLTSVASLMNILRTLFVYIDADIYRLKTTATLNSHQCLQRYVRETLCPICVNVQSNLSSATNSENTVNEPLCENACQYIIKTCFDETNNPYVAFALIAQGYANVIKDIQESVVELKLVERLSKLHIYLYDMVVNVTNTQQIYIQLQNACPDPNGKKFNPIVSLPPITGERRERVTKWNESLHFMLDQLQALIGGLNTSLIQQITTDICSNSNYATKSNRCTQIDQHMPENFTQWPLPPLDTSSHKTTNLNIEITRNQLDELKKKLTPVQQVIISLRPKEKVPILQYIFDFEYDSDFLANGTDIQPSSSPYIDVYENDNPESLSERLYKEFDAQSTRRTTSTTKTTTKYPKDESLNYSQSVKSNIASNIIVLFVFIIYRIWFTND